MPIILTDMLEQTFVFNSIYSSSHYNYLMSILDQYVPVTATNEKPKTCQATNYASLFSKMNSETIFQQAQSVHNLYLLLKNLRQTNETKKQSSTTFLICITEVNYRYLRCY